MRQVTYFPLEPLKARYTELLSRPGGWVEQAFSKTFAVASLHPNLDDIPSVMNITTGEVLDSINRPLWALEQVKMWLQRASRSGLIYFDDLFHPGIEALPYSRSPFTAAAFCWAQSFDEWDFTRPMWPWMRPYEHMAMEILSRVFVASDMLRELMCVVNPDWGDKIEVVGLPFNSGDVLDQMDPSGGDIGYDVVYSSRLDKEKNPSLFIELARSMPDTTFAVLTGHDALRGTDVDAVKVLQDIERCPKNLAVHAGLTKGRYYNILNNSKVQFNCASQDWVSFTLLEALTFGCVPVYPMHRSFIETLGHYGSPYLYRHLDAQSAKVYVEAALDAESFPPARDILEYHDGTLERIADALKNT